MNEYNEELGMFLLSRGVISREQFDQVMLAHHKTGQHLKDILHHWEFISADDLDAHITAYQHSRLMRQLHLIFDMEMILSDFYYLCAEHFSDATDFWRMLGDDAVRHTFALSEIISIAHQNPQAFSLMDETSPSEVERIIEMVRDAHLSVKRNQLSLDKALLISHNFESEMMENGVYEMITICPPEAKELLEMVKAATERHMQKLMHVYSTT
jgi:hypothetical protein